MEEEKEKKERTFKDVACFCGSFGEYVTTNAALFKHTAHDYLIIFFLCRMLMMKTIKKVFTFLHFLDHWAPHMNFNVVLCEKVCLCCDFLRPIFLAYGLLLWHTFKAWYQLLANINRLLANRLCIDLFRTDFIVLFYFCVCFYCVCFMDLVLKSLEFRCTFLPFPLFFSFVLLSHSIQFYYCLFLFSPQVFFFFNFYWTPKIDAKLCNDQPLRQ